MNIIRRQLTLFLTDQNEAIEKIRAEFNPIQYNLIPAHVTLCREDEIEPIESIIENIHSIHSDKPVRIEFGPIERFGNDKGVLIPAGNKSNGFYELRKAVLKGIIKFPREHLPHITLMHPRNSTCTNIIFAQIKKYKLPAELRFDKISLIEQRNWGRWTIIEQFSIIK